MNVSCKHLKQGVRSLTLLPWLISALAIKGAQGVEDCDRADFLAQNLTVTALNRQTETIALCANGSDTLIHISSEFGIGSATIAPAAERWPESITVRLHLHGLEGLTVTNGTTMLDKHQLDVQAYDQNAKPSSEGYLMTEAGYYEVRLPQSLFAGEIASIQIQWVDFYRY
ncbi:MAG: hypothetical protein AAF716_22680 [Cyanobacteria bacterium P01_D01_bin.1]